MRESTGRPGDGPGSLGNGLLDDVTDVEVLLGSYDNPSVRLPMMPWDTRTYSGAEGGIGANVGTSTHHTDGAASGAVDIGGDAAAATPASTGDDGGSGNHGSGDTTAGDGRGGDDEDDLSNIDSQMLRSGLVSYLRDSFYPSLVLKQVGTAATLLTFTLFEFQC